MSRQAFVAIAIAVLLALPIAAAPVVFFATYGDPFSRGFVERRPEGLYVQYRMCDPVDVDSVDVSIEHAGATAPATPFWSTTRTAASGAQAVKLFSSNPGFTTSTRAAPPTGANYVVDINKDRPDESLVILDPESLPAGNVAYEGSSSLTRARYEAMSDSDFGC